MSNLILHGTQVNGTATTHSAKHDPFVAPYDETIERSLIGCVLVNPSLLAIIKLDAADFFLLRHRYIWDAIMDVYGNGEPVERQTVRRRMEALDRWNMVGGNMYFSELIAGTSSTFYAPHYAELIRRDAFRRRILTMSDRIRETAVNKEMSVEEVNAEIQREAADITNGLHRDTISSANDISHQLMELFEETDTGVVPLGLPRLNENLGGGIRRGNIALVAAPSGTGKTWFAMNTALSVAKQKRTDGRKMRVLFFSMEMLTKREFNPRMIAIHTGLDAGRCMTPSQSLSNDERKQFTEGALDFVNYDIRVDEASEITPAYVKSIVAQHQPDLVIIDYLQMMTDDEYHRGNRHREISSVIRKLKTIAKESRDQDGNEAAFLLLAQLNREGIKWSRNDKEPPHKEAVKESGDIENYCAQIIMLWQPEHFEELGYIVPAVRKNRFGHEYAGLWRTYPPIYKKHPRNGRISGVPKMKVFVDKDES